jgi:hypothetical protein
MKLIEIELTEYEDSPMKLIEIELTEFIFEPCMSIVQPQWLIMFILKNGGEKGNITTCLLPNVDQAHF